MSYSDWFSNRRVLEVYHIDCIWHYMRGVHVSRQTLVVLREKYTRVKKTRTDPYVKASEFTNQACLQVFLFFPERERGRTLFLFDNLYYTSSCLNCGCAFVIY